MAVVGLYLALVLLELHWNLDDWRPQLDSQAIVMVLGSLAALATIGLLTHATRDRVSQAISLVLALAILSMAIYVFPPEPSSQGFFARYRPSPFWYRGGRFLLMAMPIAFWTFGVVRQRKTRSRSASFGMRLPAD